MIRDFKRHTAKEILAAARQDDKLWLLKQLEFFKGGYKKESQHQAWQEGVHPQAITSEEMLRQKLDYIHYNPVKIGLVDHPEDWRYSSACNYFGREGVMEIDLVEL